MRRMVKEDLLTFEGKRLFPERIAETVPYELTDLEYDLYEQVTAYVREGMNRADQVGGKRKNTVGFALTVLQRRLASSPEAIYKSLVRRSERLDRKKQEILNGTYTRQRADRRRRQPRRRRVQRRRDRGDRGRTTRRRHRRPDRRGTRRRTARTRRSDRTSPSRCVTAGTDRKWTELSTILQDTRFTTDENGWPRKLIIFTEHRDTLDYLMARIRLTDRQTRRRQSRSTAACAAEIAGRSPRSSPRTPTARSCSPPTRPARA